MNIIPNTTLTIDGVLRSYKTESGIELLTRIDKKLEQRPWPMEGWEGQNIYGWIIGYNPRISAVGATVLYWDKTNNQIEGTPVNGIIGNERTLPSTLNEWSENQLKPFSERLNIVYGEAEVSKMVKKDAKQFLDKVGESGVYDIIHRTIEEVKTSENVDPGMLSKGFIARHMPEHYIEVYNVQNIVDLSVMSFQEAKEVFERNKVEFHKTSHGYTYKQGDSERVITDPHRFVATLSPPNGYCFLSLSNGKLGFYEPFMYRFGRVERLAPTGDIDEKYRFVPKTGEEFLKCMYEICLLTNQLHEKENSVFENLNELLLQTRIEKSRKAARDKFGVLDETFRQLFLSTAIKNEEVTPGSKYAIAEVCPNGAIWVKMGEVVDVWKTEENETLYPTSKKGIINITSDLDLEVSYVDITTLSDRGPNMVAPEDSETKLTYEDGIETLHFLGNLSGRLFEPTSSWGKESNIISLEKRDFPVGSEIPEVKVYTATLPVDKHFKPDSKPNLFLITTESEGPYREATMVRRVEKPFRGSFSLPKIFRVSDENFDLFYGYAKT